MGMPPVCVCVMEITALPHRVVVRIKGSQVCKTLSPQHFLTEGPACAGTRLGRGWGHCLHSSLTEFAVRRGKGL